MYPCAFPRLLRTSNLILPALCLLTAYGCGRGPQTPTPAASSAMRVVRTAAAFASPAADALARVRAHPLYQDAVQACQDKQYKHASDLLQHLASQPSFNAQEAAFVQQQRIICLQDAHLPVPSAVRRAASKSSPAPASFPHNARSAASAEQADCGPRALLLLCQREGIRANLPQLRQLAGTTQEGTSLAGLEKAAKSVGLKAEGVQVSREALGDVDMPALAYVNGNHFITVLSVQGRGEDATATVHDPNNAQEQTIPQERLLRLCSGYLLLARK